MKNSIYQEGSGDAFTKSLFGIVFSDILIQMLIIIIFFFTMLVMEPHEKNKEAQAAALGLGDLCVELSWPNDRDIDLDLWGAAPHEDQSVGWSNMHGGNLDSFRDVIGFARNPTHQMLEVMCVRHVVPGEYTFNVQYFASHEWTDTNGKEIPHLKNDPKNQVEAVVIVRKKNISKRDEVFEAKWTLTEETEEKTMMDFIVDESGAIDQKTINSRFRPLKQGFRQQ